jgi:hypothetical protein
MNTLELSLAVLKISTSAQATEGASHSQQVETTLKLLKHIHQEVSQLEEAILVQEDKDRNTWRNNCFKILEATLPSQFLIGARSAERVDRTLEVLREIYKQAHQAPDIVCPNCPPPPPPRPANEARIEPNSEILPLFEVPPPPDVPIPPSSNPKNPTKQNEAEERQPD